jgi:ribonuclease P protein component
LLLNITKTGLSIRTNAFPKVLKLRNASEFQSVYEKAAKKTSRSFVVFILANGRDQSRFGLTTPRRLGNAVIRNRIKRRIREILRTSWRLLPAGFDVVVNPRRSVYERDFAELRSELLSVLGATL